MHNIKKHGKPELGLVIYCSSFLEALGRDFSSLLTTDDFSELDFFLDMLDFNDSLSNIYTSDGNRPRKTKTFKVYNEEIAFVPVINSTNNTNFVTGILWDMSDDIGDEEFSREDKEDIVFVTEMNYQTNGMYGEYDYEIKYPARLRQYYNAESSSVYIYFEIT